MKLSPSLSELSKGLEHLEQSFELCMAVVPYMSVIDSMGVCCRSE